MQGDFRCFFRVFSSFPSVPWRTLVWPEPTGRQVSRTPIRVRSHHFGETVTRLVITGSVSPGNPRAIGQKTAEKHPFLIFSVVFVIPSHPPVSLARRSCPSDL
jgi:hypothetical protein